MCMNAKTTHKKNIGAVLEWVIAFVFTGYVLSFVIDLLPSVRTRRHLPQGEKYRYGSESEGESGSVPMTTASIEEPLTTDSVGPNPSFYRGQRV